MPRQKLSYEQRVRPLAEELICYARSLRRKYGITAAAVNISYMDELSFSIENSEVVNSEMGITPLIYITLYADERSLSFGCTDFDKDTLKETILEQAKVIHFVPKNKSTMLLPKDQIYKGDVPDLDLYDESNVREKDMIRYARRVEKSALAQQEIKQVYSTSISRTLSESFFMATNGLTLFTRDTKFFVSTEAIAMRGNEMQQASEYAHVVCFEDLPNPEALGRLAGERAARKLGSITPKTMKNASIVLGPRAAEDYFMVLYDAIDGTAVVDGTTFLKDKIGKRVVSKEITLLDNPLVVRGLESQVVDSSGIKSKQICFIENGVLKKYNCDLAEARELKIRPIGRNDGPTNKIIMPGPRSVEELIADIRNGIFISDFSGGEVDVNTRKHSREAYGRMIKNGKVTNIAVSGFAVSGDLREMFNNTFLANDTPSMPNSKSCFSAPTTRVNKVTIAGL